MSPIKYRAYICASLLLIALLFTTTLSLAMQWEGKCVGVHDGDTITVMLDGKGVRIRLYGVDCPEDSQDFGRRAKAFTSNMVYGKRVSVTSMDTDRYGRTVALVEIGGMSLSRALIANGLGWVYTAYCHAPECGEWQYLEENARAEKHGLWASPNPLPPWEWRKAKRAKTASRTTVPVSPIVHHSESAGQSLPYRGNSKSRVFHISTCALYNGKNCGAYFTSIKEAVSAGYRPCRRCSP